MFGIRWRETSLTPDPRVQDSEPYYFKAPNCPGKKSPWQLNQGFDARLQTVAEWLSNCETHHAECRETVSILPKRLLGLEQTEHSKVLKLVESSAITEKNIRYATLSHCWGPKTSAPPLRTTSSNIKDHIQGISLGELTLNFRHAVSICLKLGIRYLWIDSLCIIQDSQADWEAEAAKMADIYRSGYLNIAAVAASDAHEGFIRDELVENQRDRFTDIKYTIGPDNVQELISLQPSFGFEEFRHLSANTYPYFSRGWILQEQILAPRTVLFPSGQFFWQCRHWFSSEDGTLSSKSLLTVSNGDTNLWTKLDINSRYLGQVAWYNWAGSFIRRQLLYASDIGPAIGGLIRFYSSQMGYTPILGLWKETLAFDLGWRLTHSTAGKQPDKPGNENNFPSWTWLSVLPFPESDGYFNQSIMIDEDTSYLEIKTWEEKWSGPAYTSKLQSSRLVVSGLVRTKTVNMDGTEYKASSEQGKQYEILVSGSTSETGRCLL
ncbi:hypothetical protein FPRO03_04636 [Fusarium proliferatum]|nr:hypothetical protein FPRO03_04636 [Fusarium proliferatum]